MQGNSALMSGCTQKVLSCIEGGFTSQTTLSSITTWCMCTMEPQSQDTLDDGKHWNWCHGTTGGQGCPDMLPGLSWGAVTLGSPGYGQGPLGLADIRSATRLPPQPLVHQESH